MIHLRKKAKIGIAVNSPTTSIVGEGAMLTLTPLTIYSRGALQFDCKKLLFSNATYKSPAKKRIDTVVIYVRVTNNP